MSQKNNSQTLNLSSPNACVGDPVTLINRILVWVSSVLIVFSLSSCGFHLRGDYKLPSQMASTYIKADDKNSELVRVLARSLKTSNVNVVATQQQAQSILTIANEKQEKRVLSVDTQGRAREYEISYQIDLNVSAVESDFSIAEQTLKLQRDFLFDTEDVLGKSREEDTLIKDMQQDMVRLIMLRLQAATKI